MEIFSSTETIVDILRFQSVYMEYWDQVFKMNNTMI